VLVERDEGGWCDVGEGCEGGEEMKRRGCGGEGVVRGTEAGGLERGRWWEGRCRERGRGKGERGEGEFWKSKEWHILLGGSTWIR